MVEALVYELEVGGSSPSHIIGIFHVPDSANGEVCVPGVEYTHTASLRGARLLHNCVTPSRVMLHMIQLLNIINTNAISPWDTMQCDWSFTAQFLSNS